MMQHLVLYNMCFSDYVHPESTPGVAKGPVLIPAQVFKLTKRVEEQVICVASENDYRSLRLKVNQYDI